MKIRRKALSHKNAPRRIPLWTIAVWWLLLDRFNAPGWAVGAVLTIASIVVAVSIYDFFTAEDVELPEQANVTINQHFEGRRPRDDGEPNYNPPPSYPKPPYPVRPAPPALRQVREDGKPVETA